MIDELPGLEAMRSFRDPKLGIQERFLSPVIGGERTVAVLSTPTKTEPRSLGWVICSPFGIEQTYLYPLEVAASRRLAAAGFSTLRFHAQGYGDSELSPESVTLDSHIRDARDAVKILLEERGVEEVGLLGGFLGGSVAAIVGEEMGARALALWQPVVDGERYVRRLFRTWILENLSRGERNRPAGDAWDVVRDRGTIAVHGFPVTQTALEGFASFNLVSSLTSFRGTSLITQVSNRAKPDEDLEALQSRLRDLEGSTEFRVVQDEVATRFGFDRYALRGWGDKVDTQLELSRALIETTMEWIGQELEPSLAPASEATS